MRFLIRIMTALAVLGALPAAAQTTLPEAPPGMTYDQTYGVACTDYYADWQSAMAGYWGDGTDNDVHAVPSQTVAAADGHNTIFRCQVGGHAVRINLGFPTTPLYRCGATQNAELSAWVDGVKVVSRRSWGDYGVCSGDDRQLARVLVNDRLHLTVCDRLVSTARETPFSPSDLKPGQQVENAINIGDGKPRYYLLECTLSDIVIPAGAHDLPETPTPPGIDLIVDTGAICRTDMDKAPDALPELVNWSPDQDAYKAAGDRGAVRHDFSLDLDNDGTMDTLTAAMPTGDLSELMPMQYAWTNGRTGQHHPIGGSLIGDDPLTYSDSPFTDAIYSDIRFVRIEGRVYLYTTALMRIGGYTGSLQDFENDAAVSEMDFGPSRQLFELHGDGTVAKLCAWAPRKRPEEFL